MLNMGELMKQAQEFQQRMQSLQEELAAKRVTGMAGGGMVSVSVNGRGELLALDIEPELLGGGDREMLQDLIVAAVNDGLRKARDLGREEMGKLTGGLRIPGLF